MNLIKILSNNSIERLSSDDQRISWILKCEYATMRWSWFKWNRRDPTWNPLYLNHHVFVRGILYKCQDHVARFMMYPTQDC